MAEGFVGSRFIAKYGHDGIAELLRFNIREVDETFSLNIEEGRGEVEIRVYVFKDGGYLFANFHIAAETQQLAFCFLAKTEQFFRLLLIGYHLSGDKLPRPDVCIRLISSNVTNAIFVQRLMDAQRHGGKCLYSQFNEIELLNDISRGAIGGKKEMSKILRLAYDNDEYGQERLTAQAVSGHAPIRWNWAASSTIQNTRRFFKPMLTDGTMNRIGFSFVPMLNRCMIPASGIYDQSFADEIAPAIENLRKSPRVTHEYDEVIGKKQVSVNQKGEAIMQKGILDMEKAYCVELEDGRREVYCPEAYKLAVDLNQENADAWMKTDDAAFNSFSLRANVIAYKKAMVLYVANGCQWDESFEAFIRWSEQYDLWCKMQLFAKDAEPMLGDETLDTGHVKMHNMLSDLEDEFTMADLKNVRMMRGKTPDCTSQLQNWVNRGYVERIGKDCYRKVG